MLPLSKRQKYLLLLFLLLIIVLVVVSFWRSLDFYFWRDDWDLWSTQNYFWRVLKGHNHPGTWVSRALLYHIFGWDRVAWQSLGLVLRVVTSLSVSLFMLGISKSTRTAVLAGILFAPSIFAMETVTWSSVYIVPEVIILTCLGFYFWTVYIERRLIKHAIFSILLLTIAGIGDPGRAIFVVPMMSLWEILNFWISKKREKFYIVILRAVAIFILLSILVRISLLLLYKAPISVIDNIKQVINDPKSLQTLFDSVGNLLLGWIQSPQGGSLQYLSLPILIILFLISLVLVLGRKSRNGAILLLLTLWIPILYIPNWIFNKSLVVPPTDRYLSLSAVGYIGILAVGLSSIKLRFFFYFLVALFIIFSINTANKVLDKEASYRSYKIVEPIWEKIDQDVPKGEMNSIFMYSGNNFLKYAILEWSQSTPFGIRRGFKRYEDFPITTSDEKLILKLLCEDNVYRPSIFDWIYQKERIPISHLHAWDLNGGILKNVSIEQREKFRKDTRLNNCIVEE